MGKPRLTSFPQDKHWFGETFGNKYLLWRQAEHRTAVDSIEAQTRLLFCPSVYECME